MFTGRPSIGQACFMHGVSLLKLKHVLFVIFTITCLSNGLLNSWSIISHGLAKNCSIRSAYQTNYVIPQMSILGSVKFTAGRDHFAKVDTRSRPNYLIAFKADKIWMQILGIELIGAEALICKTRETVDSFYTR